MTQLYERQGRRFVPLPPGTTTQQAAYLCDVRGGRVVVHLVRTRHANGAVEVQVASVEVQETPASPPYRVR